MSAHDATDDRVDVPFFHCPRHCSKKGRSVVALVRLKARASELAGAGLIEGDARDESALHVLKFACVQR